MIVTAALAVILFNALFLTILNKDSYASKWIRPQPRIIFTALALNDLANGFLVLGIGIIPAISQCWPFGESLCQMQVFDQFLLIFDNLTMPLKLCQLCLI